jgi:hypothetical protein
MIACFLLYGAFDILLAVLMGLLFSSDTDGSLPLGAVARYLLPPAMALLGAAAIVAGIGLARRAPWSRAIAILLAAISLLFIPIGTLFGAFALWALSTTSESRIAENSVSTGAH